MPLDDQDALTAARNLIFLAAAARAVQGLGTRGVPTLLLKGTALLETVYALEERPMGDVDLLVPPRLLRRASAALDEMGLERDLAEDRPIGAFLYYEGTYFTSDGVALDVHFGLAQPPLYEIDYEGVFARAVPAPHLSADVPARRLSNEDLLLHLAIHQARHDYKIDVRAAGDVDRVVRRLPIDWAVVTERARLWRCTCALWLTLRHAAARAGTPIPEGLVESLRPPAWRRGYLERLLDLGRVVPYRRASHGRRRAQVLASVAATDDLWRFAAAALSFGAVRAADWIFWKAGIAKWARSAMSRIDASRRHRHAAGDARSSSPTRMPPG